MKVIKISINFEIKIIYILIFDKCQENNVNLIDNKYTFYKNIKLKNVFFHNHNTIIFTKTSCFLFYYNVWIKTY